MMLRLLDSIRSLYNTSPLIFGIYSDIDVGLYERK